jgi:prophage regulatory protein
MKQLPGTSQANTPPPLDVQDRFCSPRETSRIVNLSRTTLWRQVCAGAFPAPVRISPGRIAWRRSDLERWIEAPR